MTRPSSCAMKPSDEIEGHFRLQHKTGLLVPSIDCVDDIMILIPESNVSTVIVPDLNDRLRGSIISDGEYPATFCYSHSLPLIIAVSLINGSQPGCRRVHCSDFQDGGYSLSTP